MTTLFDSTKTVKSELNKQRYIASDEIATIVYLAQKLGKPLLTEGPAGVGKTELAKAIAGATGRELIRLQCYEGLDESKALYEWEYSKQLLYTQILREKIGQLVSDAVDMNDAGTASVSRRVCFSPIGSSPRGRCWRRCAPRSPWCC